jgi:hypothetical protein
MTRRGIVGFLRPAQARLAIGKCVSFKLYATWNSGGEIGPDIHMALPFKDQDAFDRVTVPPVGHDESPQRQLPMVFGRGCSRSLI